MRKGALAGRQEPRGLLKRLIEEPEILSLVRSLEAPALKKLIDRVGLEDASELVSLATTEQLRDLFDVDLWQADKPGSDEAFDADRFGLWLEVMGEAGPAFVAEKLAELPEELITFGLFRQVLVIDLDELALELEGHEELDLVEKALDACLQHEFDNYRVIARRHDGWDAVLGALLALDERDPPLLQALLARLCHATSDFVEENGGLYDVLQADEMLEVDASAEREDRRARQGFVSPASARSFLALARSFAGPADGTDPVTSAYFRELAPTAPATSAPRPAAGWVALLQDAGIIEEPIALLPGESKGATKRSPFGEALATLQVRDPAAYDRRTAELAYLGNVLLAGFNFGGRSLRELESVELAVAVCELGLEGADDPVDLLARWGADRLFRMGWRKLHEGATPAEVLVRIRTLLGD